MSHEEHVATAEHRVWLKGETESIVALLTPLISPGNTAWASRIFSFNHDTKVMQVTRMQVDAPVRPGYWAFVTLLVLSVRGLGQ